MIAHALIRPPSATYASGLTTSTLGAPDLARALEQHAAYAAALEAAGLEVVRLASDDRFPDATFVEDAAVLTPRGAILTRPGAPSRRGEVDAIRGALERLVPILGAVEAPGTVDGGDVLEAGSSVIIGLTERTNAEGASQLASLLALAGRRASLMELPRVPGLLHLKTGVSSLGEGRLLAWEALAGRDELRGFDVVPVSPREAYAANAVRLPDRVLMAEGFPETAAAVERTGIRVVAVPMSEFRKMDGGPSCLSLRW